MALIPEKVLFELSSDSDNEENLVTCFTRQTENSFNDYYNKDILAKVNNPERDGKNVVKYSKDKEAASISPENINLAVVKHKPEIMNLASPELIAVLFMFAVGLSGNVTVNAWLKSYCLLMPNVSDHICSGVIPEDIENKVQAEVSSMILIKSFIETILPGLTILFIGPWSDIHGRRPLLLFSLFGYMISYTIWAVLSTQTYLKPAYYLLASVPIGLTGGTITFFISLVCAITDVTSLQERAFKMAVFEAGCMVGTFTSQLFTAKVSSGPHGFTIAFSMSAVIILVAILYVYFFFPETVTHPAERIHNRVYVWDVFKTFFKSRPNYTRAVLYFAILANTAFISIIFGESSIFYLNTQKRFAWVLQDYANYNSYSVVISGLVLYFGTWLMSSVLRISDLTGLFIVSVPRICSSLIYALCSDPWYMYVGISIGCVTTLITPLYRSQVSKLIPLDDLSKIWSFVMFTEAFIPVASTSIYTSVYDHTISMFPGAIFLVSTGFAVLCTICVIICLLIHWRYPIQDFSTLTEEAAVEGTNNQVSNTQQSSINS